MRDTLHAGSSVAVLSSNRTQPFRVFAALLACMIALAGNIALLSIASAVGIPHGVWRPIPPVHKDHSPCHSGSFLHGWLEDFCTARLSGRIP
jgi:hypothetical protein